LLCIDLHADPALAGKQDQLRLLNYPNTDAVTEEEQGQTVSLPDLLMLLCPDTLLKALSGKKTDPYLLELLGDRFSAIRNIIKKERDKVKKQQHILVQLNELLQEKGYYALQFKINPPDSEEADFYLLFASQAAAAYKAFKEFMLAYSAYAEDGVPLLVANCLPKPQLSLFPQPLAYSVLNLAEELGSLAGRYKFKSIEKIYEDHSAGTPYTRENYLAAFERLRGQGKVELLNAKTMQTIRKPLLSSVVKYRLPA
jgi:hypothetical protein